MRERGSRSLGEGRGERREKRENYKKGREKHGKRNIKEREKH